MAETIILCIDDDVLALAALVQRLETAGYAIFRSSDPDHGLVLFEESRPDLVILDVGMQRGRGWELFEQLISAGARVFIVSAQGLEEDLIRGLESGAVDYVTKPYKAAELLSRIKLRLQQNAPQISAAARRFTPVALAGSRQEPPAAEPMPPLVYEEPRPSAAAPEPEPEPDGPPTFGRQLRQARRERSLSLVQAELDTHIRMYYIQALEEEKFALLPRGPASERIVKDYARYLGLNPQEIVGEYRALFRSEGEPVRDLGVEPLGRAQPRLRLLSWALAALLAVALGCGALTLIAPAKMDQLWHNVRALVVPSATPTVTPTPTPTATPTPTLSPTPTASPTATATPTPSPTLAPTPSISPSPGPSPTATQAR